MTTKLTQTLLALVLLFVLVAAAPAITDRFKGNSGSIMAPASHVLLVTPNDSADLTYTTRAIYVGGTGNIKLTTAGGETLILTAVQVGTLLPIRVTRVWATDTTATNMAAFD